MRINNVVIGIQARMSSKRLPGKSLMPIGEKPMIKHVIDACESAARYLNPHKFKTKYMVHSVLLIPHGDELAQYARSIRYPFIEGPEDDVLTRYAMMAEKMDADYIVRVTGDCPLIPPNVIQNAIKNAVMNQSDYVSNVDPRIRTAPDGHDVEVISRKLLEYVHHNATDPGDREHVTTFARREPFEGARFDPIIGFLPVNLKISVDTEDDLELVRAVYNEIQASVKLGRELYGEKNVHRFQ